MPNTDYFVPLFENKYKNESENIINLVTVNEQYYFIFRDKMTAEYQFSNTASICRSKDGKGILYSFYLGENYVLQGAILNEQDIIMGLTDLRIPTIIWQNNNTEPAYWSETLINKIGNISCFYNLEEDDTENLQKEHLGQIALGFMPQKNKLRLHNNLFYSVRVDNYWNKVKFLTPHDNSSLIIPQTFSASPLSELEAIHIENEKKLKKQELINIKRHNKYTSNFEWLNKKCSNNCSMLNPIKEENETLEEVSSATFATR